MAHEDKRPLKVFLCHASGDKPPVRDLYKRLTIEGVDAWLDKEKLLPGQDWRLVIPKAVQEADVVVVCLSNKSITKEGYVQKEIKFALDIAEEKPEGAIFLIPARLEDCVVPERLSRWEWVDLYEENGFIRLLRSLKLRADAVGATVKPTPYVDSDKETERKLDQLYTEGLAAFYTEDWDRACHRFQSILSESPNHKNAAEKLAEAERQRNLAKSYEQASEAIRYEDWQSAIKIMEELSQKAAGYKDVTQLLRDARKRKQLKELYAEAEKLHAAMKWQAVVKVFEQISILEPNFPDANGLLSSAEKEVAEIRRIEELNNQYSHALREMDAGNWHEARRMLESVHKSQTGFLETEKLLRKVENEILKGEEKRKQGDQVNTLYEQAHGLLRSRKWRNALDKLEQIQKLDEHFPDTDGIVEKAQKELAREEQEADRQNKLAAMYAEAVKLLREEKYQEALDKWQEVKAVDPKYPDRQWVQRAAKKNLGGARKTAVARNDWKSKLAGVFPQKETEASTWAQTYVGWLIPFVAISWGLGRFAIEILVRVTNFFGIGEWGGGFWIAEIVLGTFGLIYGLTFRLALPFLGITIDRKKTILLMAGWLAGFVLAPVIGFSFSGLTNQSWTIGSVLAGLVAGLATALILWSTGAISTIRQILVFAAGIALSVYIGEQISGSMIVDLFSPAASYPLAFGSAIAGMFSASVLEYQVSKDVVNAAPKRCLILLAALGFGLARLIQQNLFVGIPPELGWGLRGVLQGLIMALALRSVQKDRDWKTFLTFGVGGAVVYPLTFWALQQQSILLTSMLLSLAPVLSILTLSLWKKRREQWQSYSLIFMGWTLAWVIGQSLAIYINPLVQGAPIQWVICDALVGGMGLWITIDLLKSKSGDMYLGAGIHTQTDAAKLLLQAFIGVIIVRVMWGPFQGWLHIWEGKLSTAPQFLSLFILGAGFGAVVAFSLQRFTQNWRPYHSLIVIVGWALGFGVPILAIPLRLDFNAVLVTIVGLAMVVAIKLNTPSISPLKMTLIFMSLALARIYGNMLGDYLNANVSNDYISCFSDATNVFLGLLATFGFYEYGSERLAKLTFMSGVGVAFGYFAGTALARLLSVSPLIETPLQYALLGFAGGAVFELPSQDWKKILIKGGICAGALALAGFIFALPFASRYLWLRIIVYGAVFGLVVGLSTRKISIATNLMIVGAAIFTITYFYVARLGFSVVMNVIVSGALIGMVIGFGYAYLTRDIVNRELTG